MPETIAVAFKDAVDPAFKAGPLNDQRQHLGYESMLFAEIDRRGQAEFRERLACLLVLDPFVDVAGGSLEGGEEIYGVLELCVEVSPQRRGPRILELLEQAVASTAPGDDRLMQLGRRNRRVLDALCRRD